MNHNDFTIFVNALLLGTMSVLILFGTYINIKEPNTNNVLVKHIEKFCTVN